jgi:hypothetical protein
MNPRKAFPTIILQLILHSRNAPADAGMTIIPMAD